MSCKPNFETGSGDALFVKNASSSTFGAYSTTDEPTSTDHIPHLSFNANFAQQREPSAEKNASRSVVETFTLRKEGSFDASFYLKGGTTPLLDVLLAACIGSKTGSSSTGTISSVAASADGKGTDLMLGAGEGGGFSVGQSVAIPVSDGTYTVHLITAISTDTLTVAPKIPTSEFSYLSTKTVTGGYAYKPDPQLSKCLIMAFYRANEAYFYSGVIPGKATFEGDGNSPVRVTFDGPIGDNPVYMGSAAQFVDHDSMSTTLQIPKGDGRKFTTNSLVTWYDVSAGDYLKDPSGIKEKMRVTAIDTSPVDHDELTVTRGVDATTALDPDSADLIVPWRPDTQSGGTILSGALNVPYTIQIGEDGTSTDDHLYTVRRWQVVYDNSVQLINDTYGSDHASGFATGKKNQCQLTMEAYMSRDFFREYGRARNLESARVMIRAGNALGKMVGIYMPRVDLNAQAVEDADNDALVTTTFAGDILAQSGDDEVYVLFA